MYKEFEINDEVIVIIDNEFKIGTIFMENDGMYRVSDNINTYNAMFSKWIDVDDVVKASDCQLITNILKKNKIENDSEILTEAKRQLIEYIREFGYCGYVGECWTEYKLNCLECVDKRECERYKLLTKWE